MRNPPLSEGALPPRAGLGLKPEHYGDIVAHEPDVGFFEVHAENYMGDGGAPHRALQAIAAHYPLSLHGVGLSIGAARPLDRQHLARLRGLIDRYRPRSFSEHLAWSTHDIGFLNDLLPLPYTPETLERVSRACRRGAAGDRPRACCWKIRRPISCSRTARSTRSISSTRWRERSGCGLLLDVNNVMVSAVNHRLDPFAYVDRFPVELVGEIHLAGYDEATDGEGDRLLIDAHGSPVRNDVFALYRHTIAPLRAGGDADRMGQ